MAVTVCVHMDLTDEGATWWADSDSVPGFTAVADSMTELLMRATVALQDLMVEGDVDEDDIQFQLTDPATWSGNSSRVDRPEQSPADAPSHGARSRVLVSS